MPQEDNSRQSSQGLIHSLSASFSNAREEEHSAQEEHDLGTDLGQFCFNCLGPGGNPIPVRHEVMRKQ